MELRLRGLECGHKKTDVLRLSRNTKQFREFYTVRKYHRLKSLAAILDKIYIPFVVFKLIAARKGWVKRFGLI